MPPKPNLKKGGNGRMLTVKQLDRRSYAAIHNLPRGLRGPTLKALLKLFADYLESNKGIAATDALELIKSKGAIVAGRA